MLKHKLLLTAAVVLSTVISSGAIAATQDIGASVIIKQAIAISNVQDINFGHIDYNSASDEGVIYMGTNGTINNNTGDFILSGVTNAASFEISSDGSTVEISCENFGELANANGDIVTLHGTEIANGVGGNYGESTGCSSINNNPLIASGDISIKLGGQLAIGATYGGSDQLTGGTYSTANAGGDPITVSVVYQ